MQDLAQRMKQHSRYSRVHYKQFGPGDESFKDAILFTYHLGTHSYQSGAKPSKRENTEKYVLARLADGRVFLVLGGFGDDYDLYADAIFEQVPQLSELTAILKEVKEY